MKITLDVALPRLFLHRVVLTAATVVFFQMITPSYAAEVTLAWEATTAQNVAGYLVYYKKGYRGGPPYDGKEATDGESPVKIGNVTTYTLSGLRSSGRYFFAVRAFDSKGTRSSYSNEVCINCNDDIQSEEIAEKKLVPIELAIVAPVKLPSGEVIKLSRGQIEIIKKQTGIFYGTKAADMLGPGEVVVTLPDELGGGYVYGKPEYLARAFAEAEATKGSAAATHLFVKRGSCLLF